MENQIDVFKKMAGEAIIESHKAQSNAIALTQMFKLLIQKYHPEFTQEYISEFKKERNKAMIELISNSPSIPPELKETSLNRIKENPID